MLKMVDFISRLPKAELHVHIEGTLEPELMFALAERNNIRLKYRSVDELRKAYSFNSLQEFLDIYYEGAKVLLYEADFYDLTMAYLQKAYSQNIIHVELFFDPQTHTHRGIEFETVINGIYRALEDGKLKFGITSYLILCFLRHLNEESAMKTLKQAIPSKDKILGVGLDSSEKGNPPSKFRQVFTIAREMGFLTFAHAGEEGPPEYVRDAIENLHINRIDHGNRAFEDETLTELIIRKQIPLTICPLSNLRLKVVDELKNHPLKKMVGMNILATVNSDDPAYFGGYINENFIEISIALCLTKAEITRLASNSIKASCMPEEMKKHWLSEIKTIMLKS